MKRSMLLVAGACLFAPSAWAQPDLAAYRGMKPTTRPVCEAKCNRMQFGENIYLVEQEAKITQIRYQAKLETDPDKQKLLRGQEEQLTERRQRYIGRMCKQICMHNPEN